jgi:hypothetical protein
MNPVFPYPLPMTTRQALDWFDRLPAVSNAQMLGTWRGMGCPTRHPLDGLLEAYHWWGKSFLDDNSVHPLVFVSTGGKHLSIDPARLPVPLLKRSHLPRQRWLGDAFQRLLPALRSHRPKARLRQIEHRGVVTAAMLYDDWPINDVFRQIDDHTVLGLMDYKGMAQPFFFVLQRATG